MEFGWINLFGGIIVVLILIPNILYAIKMRRQKTAEVKIPNVLSVFEQIGRYACMILMWLPLLVWKFGFGSIEELLAYFLLNGVLIILYYLIWCRYAGEATVKRGMALAVLPTAVFFLSGLLLRHWLLAAAAVIFGVAHIRITYLTHSGRPGMDPQK